MIAKIVAILLLVNTIVISLKINLSNYKQYHYLRKGSECQCDTGVYHSLASVINVLRIGAGSYHF